jgi:hypothetical protein
LDTYKSLLDLNCANLKLIREGSVDGWILRAKVVIQRSCVTAVESALAGVPTLSPRWFPAKDYPVPESVSIPAASMDELITYVDQALKGQIQTPSHIQSQLQTVIHDWFYKMDGESHQRVADAVIMALKYTGTRETTNTPMYTGRIDHTATLRELYRLDRPLRSTRKKIARSLRFMLRQPPETEGQFERRERSFMMDTRRFDAAEAQKWLDAINTVTGKNSAQARPLDRRDTLVPMRGYFSVVIEPQ